MAGSSTRVRWLVAVIVGAALVFNLWMNQRWDDELARSSAYCESLTGSPSLDCLDSGNRAAAFFLFTVPWWLGNIAAVVVALALLAPWFVQRRRDGSAETPGSA